MDSIERAIKALKAHGEYELADAVTRLALDRAAMTDQYSQGCELIARIGVALQMPIQGELDPIEVTLAAVQLRLRSQELENALVRIASTGNAKSSRDAEITEARELAIRTLRGIAG
jgi:hypothetical protein